MRDFVYSEEQIAKQQDELEMADTTEKELWVRCVMTVFENSFLSLLADGTTALIAHKLLRVLPDPRASKSCSPFC